jgi:hypothetical protein
VREREREREREISLCFYTSNTVGGRCSQTVQYTFSPKTESCRDTTIQNTYPLVVYITLRMTEVEGKFLDSFKNEVKV